MLDYKLYGGVFIFLLACLTIFLLVLFLFPKLLLFFLSKDKRDNFFRNEKALIIFKIVSLGLLLFSITLIIFQILGREWIFYNFNHVNNGSNINTEIYQLSQIVVPTMGVVITGIFSYLIYYSAEKAVAVAKDIYKVETKRDIEKKEEKKIEAIKEYQKHLLRRIEISNRIEGEIEEYIEFVKTQNYSEALNKIEATHNSLIIYGEDIYMIFTRMFHKVRLRLVTKSYHLENEIINNMREASTSISKIKSGVLSEYIEKFLNDKNLNQEELKYLEKHKSNLLRYSKSE